MKYGCNFSHELMELLEEDPNLCDYIKIGAFGDTFLLLEKAYQKKPLLIHGFGWFERAGMPDLEVMDFPYMNKLLREFQSPWLGMHALMYERDEQDDAFSHMKKNLLRIKEELELPLILENMDHSPFYSYENSIKASVEGDFIRQLTKEVDCGFLLDLSHARVSAWQLGKEIIEYLEELPLERTREIHFSGAEYREGEGYHDRHSEMTEDDFLVAQFIADQLQQGHLQELEVITLEYGSVGGLQTTDKEAIRRQIKRLKSIFG